jgi:hypothetical protein
MLHARGKMGVLYLNKGFRNWGRKSKGIKKAKIFENKSH